MINETKVEYIITDKFIATAAAVAAAVVLKRMSGAAGDTHVE